MLTKKEEELKQYLFNVFVPTLHEMIKDYDIEKYNKWNGNLCRQTAFAGTVFLNGAMPEYEWQAWEGTFDDVYQGKPCRYEHAWIFGKNKDNGKRLFLDLSNNVKERLFIETKVNGYPKDSDEHKDMKCISRTRLDIEEMMKQKEYNTSLTGPEFMKELMARLVKKLSITDIIGYMISK